MSLTYHPAHSVRCLFAAVLLTVASPVHAQEPNGAPDLVENATRLATPTAQERHDALISLLDHYGLSYEIQQFQQEPEDPAPSAGRNVSVWLGSGHRQLIVGAHSDAAKLTDGTLSQAMVDNAAAVAILVRLATTLQHHEFKHRIRIVFFDLEERGLLGSRHLVSTIAPDAVAGMINLDIAGYGDTIIYGPSANRGNAPLFAALHHVCTDADTRCLEFPVFPPSDDRSFQRAGIPNISLATLPRREAHQLWLVLNTDPDESGLAPGFVPPILQLIHTDSDTQDKLDDEAMRLAYNVVKKLLLRLDQRLP